MTIRHTVSIGILFAALAAGCSSGDRPSEKTGTTSAAISFVQTSNATPASATSVSVAYANAQAAGDTNVIAIGWAATTTIKSVTDTKGNTYSAAATLQDPSAQPSGASASIWYAPNVLAGSDTVTVTFNGTVNYPDVRIAEYSGLGGLDVTASAMGAVSGSSSTTVSSGNATTTAAGDLLVGSNYLGWDTDGPGSGFTSRVITNDSTLLEDKVAGAAGAYAATCAIHNGGGSSTAWWLMQLAAFKPASSADAGADASDGATDSASDAQEAGTDASDAAADASDGAADDSSDAQDAVADTGSDTGSDASDASESGADATADAQDAAADVTWWTTTYSTTFPLNEAPVSEDLAWTHLDTNNALVDTAGGVAFGTQAGTGAFNDSYAHLDGFPPNQSASAVIHLNRAAITGGTHEVEIILRMNDSPSWHTGYECNLAYDGSYTQIVWLGQGASNWMYLSNIPGVAPNDGDTFSAQIVGSTITVYLNGVQINGATDTTYATGNPAMGFWRGAPSSVQSDYGFKTFSARSIP